MFSGVTLAASEGPEELVERQGLRRRVNERGIQFLLRDG